MTWHPDIPEEYRNQIVTGDARVLAERIPDESVDLIFTDPPYPKEFLWTYEWLAKISKRILKDNGSLIALCPQYHLLKIIEYFSSILSYHWICALTQSPANGWAQIHPKRVSTLWKPMLWFTKGSYDGPFIFDKVYSERSDKRYHKWGQSIIWAEPFLRSMTCYDLIFDPFTGGGTVPAVCKMLGRNYIAFEIDPDTAEAARERVRLTQPPLFVLEPEQTEMELD